MHGIQFLTDERGKRVAVQIDLKRHSRLWEDFQDVLAADSRRREKSIPIERVKAAFDPARSVGEYSLHFKASALKELEPLATRNSTDLSSYPGSCDQSPTGRL